MALAFRSVRPFAWFPSAAAVARRAFRDERQLAIAGLAQLASAALLIALMPLDGRTILGIDPWIKPLKFALSVGIYTLTVALMLLPLAPSRARSFVRWATIIPLSFETVAIALQSARGVPSHFNETSAFDAAIFAAMGVAILLATLGGATLLVLHLRSRALPRAVRWGVRAGIAVSLVGSAVGGAMVSNQGHAVGAEDGGDGLPFVGWSREGGDLRIAHFAGIHALQALPLVGIAASRARRGVALVAGATLAYVTAVGALFVAAILGSPLIR